jgi:cytochrome P450
MKNGLGDCRWDILQHFIEGKNTGGTPISKADIMIKIINIITAGADTTSIRIRAVIRSLLLHPAAFKRPQKEVDDAYRRLGLTDSHITHVDAEGLPYLSAVVKESLRMHPSIHTSYRDILRQKR